MKRVGYAELRAGVRTLKAGDYPMLFRDAQIDGAERSAFVFTQATAASGIGAFAWPLFRCATAIMGAAEMAAMSCQPSAIARDLLKNTGCASRGGEIVILGTSGGGIPALMLGSMMAEAVAPRTVKILLFGPLLRLWPVNENGRGAIYHDLVRRAARDPAVRERLERYGDAVAWFARAAGRADVRVIAFFGKDNSKDASEAALIADVPGARLVPLPTSEHALIHWMRAPIHRPARLQTIVTRRLKKEFPDLGADELSKRVAERIEAIHALRSTYPDLDAIAERL